MGWRGGDRRSCRAGSWRRNSGWPGREGAWGGGGAMPRPRGMEGETTGGRTTGVKTRGMGLAGLGNGGPIARGGWRSTPPVVEPSAAPPITAAGPICGNGAPPRAGLAGPASTGPAPI